MTTTPWLAGVDGCAAGWIVALVPLVAGNVAFKIVRSFPDVMALPEAPVVVAVDMPIGLPDHIGPAGRGPEKAVRPLLGQRRSSVFAVPSRAAIYQEDYREACRIAAITSEPSRKMSKQLFCIAPKIREVDTWLRANPVRAGEVYEVHPEVAFWRLNGANALGEPKRMKSRPYGPGIALRRDLLVGAGFAESIASARPPAGAAEDDVVDALACAAMARRIHAGAAVPFPDPPLNDGSGLRIAIWA